VTGQEIAGEVAVHVARRVRPTRGVGVKDGVGRGITATIDWWVAIYTRSPILLMDDDFAPGGDLILGKRSLLARSSAHAHAAVRHRLAITSDLRRSEMVYRRTQRVNSRGVAVVLLDDAAELLAAANLPQRDDAEGLVEYPVSTPCATLGSSRLVVRHRFCPPSSFSSVFLRQQDRRDRAIPLGDDPEAPAVARCIDTIASGFLPRAPARSTRDPLRPDSPSRPAGDGRVRGVDPRHRVPAALRLSP
jgi:hypothetical protein